MANEADSSKRAKTGLVEVMDTEARWVSEETENAARNGVRSPQPPVVSSREPDPASLSEEGDDYGLSDDDEDELGALADRIEQMEIDAAKAAAEQRTLQEAKLRALQEDKLRIAISNGDQHGTYRLIKPSQFEKESGHWPSKDDFDANLVMIRDERGEMSKAAYHKLLLENCKTRSETEQAPKAFRAKMEELGLSAESFRERIVVKPDDDRNSAGRTKVAPVPKWPLQSGANLGNIRIERPDGSVIIAHQLDHPDLVKTNFTQLQMRYGKDNVAIMTNEGIFKTSAEIEKGRKSDPDKLIYTAKQLYRSYAAAGSERPKAYFRHGDIWIDSKNLPSERLAQNIANRAQDEILIRSSTQSLLRPSAVDFVARKNRNLSLTSTIIKGAGLDPRWVKNPEETPDVLVELEHGKLKSAAALKGLSSRQPLTEIYLKEEINLLKSTGNYNTLAQRERDIAKAHSSDSAGHRYARLYDGLTAAQREQLNMPIPSREHHLAVSVPPRSASSNERASPRAVSQTPGPDTPIPSVENVSPSPSGLRDMSRETRSQSSGR